MRIALADRIKVPPRHFASFRKKRTPKKRDQRFTDDIQMRSSESRFSRFFGVRFLRNLAKMPRRLFDPVCQCNPHHSSSHARSRRRAKGATPFTIPSTKPRYLPLPPKPNLFRRETNTRARNTKHERAKASTDRLPHEAILLDSPSKEGGKKKQTTPKKNAAYWAT